jgi:hypothetical protein
VLAGQARPTAAVDEMTASLKTYAAATPPVS